eukprot:TRINITY_DN12129_c1_g2_i12.p1 TRINITY_DN12129_c1_g2~~TRINITY_DN12129_c1_g2_i12.p1  ORF type:complete len:327 (+),score=58.53 TRINITY_DN12129_c1_g2_i12:390-1370(+)
MQAMRRAQAAAHRESGSDAAITDDANNAALTGGEANTSTISNANGKERISDEYLAEAYDLAVPRDTVYRYFCLTKHGRVGCVMKMVVPANEVIHGPYAGVYYESANIFIEVIGRASPKKGQDNDGDDDDDCTDDNHDDDSNNNCIDSKDGGATVTIKVINCDTGVCFMFSNMAAHNDVVIIEAILEANAYVDAQMKKKALRHAVLYSSCDGIRVLLKYDTEVAQDAFEDDDGSQEAIRLVTTHALERGLLLESVSEDHLKGPLQSAARHGWLDLVQLAVLRKIAPSVLQAAFRASIQQGHVDVTKLLVLESKLIDESAAHWECLPC